MSDVKVCPQCDAEYFAHVTSCAHCNIELVAPEMKSAAKMHLPKPDGQLVCILEDGSFERVKDLATRLAHEGVGAIALKMSDESCAHDQYGIFVPENHAPLALEKFPAMIRKLYPELAVAEELMNSGHCPACGANLKEVWSNTCPDCGLTLIASGDHGGDNCGGGCSTC